jgi:hypothetical protein
MSGLGFEWVSAIPIAASRTVTDDDAEERRLMAAHPN